MRNYHDDGRHFFEICWLRLALIYESESSRNSKPLTGKCFRMVRIVTKNNFFEIKISRSTPIDSLSVELFSLDNTEYKHSHVWKVGKCAPV